MNSSFKKAGSFATPIAKLIDPVTHKAFLKRGFLSRDIVLLWKDIVGESLSQVSFPVKIVFPFNQRTSGVLHLDVVGSASLEIDYMRPMILERINVYFGYQAVTSIKFQSVDKRPNTQKKVSVTRTTKVSKKDKSPLNQNDLDGIDDDLRDSLSRLYDALV